jgi:hypothetical protein
VRHLYNYLLYRSSGRWSYHGSCSYHDSCSYHGSWSYHGSCFGWLFYFSTSICRSNCWLWVANLYLCDSLCYHNILPADRLRTE